MKIIKFFEENQVSILSFLICNIIFFTFPFIDIFIANMFFYDGIFPLNGKYNFTMKIIDGIIEFGCMAIWIKVILAIGIKEMRKIGRKQILHSHLIKKLFYISSVGLLGSFGIVHTLKHLISRCRPKAIQFFGGTAPFTEIWTYNPNSIKIGSSCLSFVSGHAAIGFLIYSIAFTYSVHSKKHMQYIILGSIIGGLFGFVRIIQGQHFLSDVIFSGYVVYFSALILAKIIHPEKMT